jgi:predicted N-formylglutamate amidohydrolase
VHSFTPALRGVRRNADLGLLYDPARAGELALARRWRAALREVGPELRVVNQRHLAPGARSRARVARAVEASLVRLLPREQGGRA